MVLAPFHNDAIGAPASKAFEKKLASPSPVQWKVGGVEISLIDVIWGPTDASEVISKTSENIHGKNPQFFPDRSYVLALGFQAKLPNVASTEMVVSSGLALVKSVEGDIEPPMVLTPTGFVPFSGSPGVYDINFRRTGATEYWEFFPVSPTQKEFLFEVFSPSEPMPSTGGAKFSFKIIRKDEDFVIFNTNPDRGAPCLSFKKNFAGTIGSGSRVELQLTRDGTTISGTEQYLRVGKTLTLRGSVDSLSNFQIEERYPEDQVTGLFKGKISPDCRVLTGLFSKPDGSRLQPFEFREKGATSHPDANESDPEPQ
jgi:hypothetical protein